MRRYYYTLATLPFLSFEDEAPFSHKELYEMCWNTVSAEDMEILESADIEPPHSFWSEDSATPACEALERWYKWETALRNELVSYRASRLGWETDKYLREGDVVTGVFDVARNAASQDSPLHAEELLNRARWNFLEELETGHFFEMTNLIVFSLKLQLLERKDLFTRERGEENFQQIYRTILDDIKSA